MFCGKCGRQLEEGQTLCPFCDATPTPESKPAPAEESAVIVEPVPESEPAPVEPTPAAESAPEAPATPAPPNKGKGKKEKSPKKPRKKGLIIALCILIPIVLIGVAALLSFPLSVELTTEGKRSTKDSYINNLNISISANQPILSVQYQLNNDPLVNAQTTGFLYKKTLPINKMRIPAGENTLQIFVKTLFGTSVQKVKLTYDFGYTTAPSQDSIAYLDGDRVAENELLVFFNDGTSSKDAQDLIEGYGAEIVGQIYVLNQYQIRFPGYGVYNLQDVKSQLEQEDSVAAVSYNMILETSETYYPNDSEFDDWGTTPGGNNWGLECIQAPGAWEYLDKMQGVKVGVIDSSLDYSHEDLEIGSHSYGILPSDDFSNLEDLMEYFEEYNETHNHPIFSSCRFCGQRDHGTHCAGIIAARGDNDTGVCGVNWKADLQFTTWWGYYNYGGGSFGLGESFSSMLYNISYMIAQDCRVISLSVGSVNPSSVTAAEIEDARNYDLMIQRMEKAGYDFLIMKAAGNDDANASLYRLNRIMTYGEHARTHTVIVGAIEPPRTSLWSKELRYNMAGYSNYGDIVDVVAPGSKIYSTVYGGYAYMSGTSMATPMAAGVASLLYSADPNLTYDQVKDILCAASSHSSAKGGYVYPIVNAKLAVEHVLNNSDNNPERPEPQVGFITGTIQDARNGELIQDAGVLVVNIETGVAYESFIVEDTGMYYVYADPGTYRMEFRAEGYQDEIIHNIEVTAGVTNYNIRLNMVTASTSRGLATGYVVDAFDATRVPNATLKIYKGVNNLSGTPVKTITSDDYGYYSVSLEPGNYTVLASASGYIAAPSNILVVGDSCIDYQDCVLTPVLNAGEIRVVLTWGQYPSDLDSHLHGPTPTGDTFHVYYSNKNNYYNGTKYVNLDVDDTTSYGPETTSVYVGVDGKYTFHVHDYTNRYDTYSNALATSGARIKVYVGGSGKYYEFNVPNDDGTIWVVFSIENGVLTPINRMDYGGVDYTP